MGFKVLSFSLIFLSTNLMAMERPENKFISQPNTPRKKKPRDTIFIFNEPTFKKPCLDPNKSHKRFMPEGVRQDYHKVFDDRDIVHVYVSAPFDTFSEIVPKKLWLKSIKFKDREIKVHNQVALRSCGWSCVNMVLLNHGIKDYGLAFKNQLCDALDREKVLNFHKITTELDIAIGDLNIESAKEMNITSNTFIENKDVVAHMQEKLKTYSCALVSITNKHINGHCIIVYAVEDDGVVLCDPFHGWLIKVKKEAFLNEINGSDLELGKDSQTILWVADKLK